MHTSVQWLRTPRRTAPMPSPPPSTASTVAPANSPMQRLAGLIESQSLPSQGPEAGPFVGREGETAAAGPMTPAQVARARALVIIEFERSEELVERGQTACAERGDVDTPQLDRPRLFAQA